MKKHPPRITQADVRAAVAHGHTEQPMPQPFVLILSQALAREARSLGIPETNFRVYKPPTSKEKAL